MGLAEHGVERGRQAAELVGRRDPHRRRDRLDVPGEVALGAGLEAVGQLCRQLASSESRRLAERAHRTGHRAGGEDGERDRDQPAEQGGDEDRALRVRDRGVGLVALGGGERDGALRVLADGGQERAVRGEDLVGVEGARLDPVLDAVDRLLARRLERPAGVGDERGVRPAQLPGVVRGRGRGGVPRRLERADHVAERGVVGRGEPAELRRHLVLRGEVAVVHVEVLREQVRLLGEADRDAVHGRGVAGHVVGERVDLRREAVGRRERDDGDDEQPEGEGAEGDAEAGGEPQVAQHLHVIPSGRNGTVDMIGATLSELSPGPDPSASAPAQYPRRSTHGRQRMSEPLTLELLDKDGAIREALDEGSQGTRAELFRRAVIGGGTVLAGGLLIGGLPQSRSASRPPSRTSRSSTSRCCSSTSSRSSTSRPSNSGALTGATARRSPRPCATTSSRTSSALQEALGSAAIAKPTFDFKGTTTDAGEVPGDGDRARGHGRGRLQRPGPAPAPQDARRRRRRSCRSRRATRPGSGASSAGPRYAGAPATYPAPAALDPPLSRRRSSAAVGATGFIKG